MCEVLASRLVRFTADVPEATGVQAAPLWLPLYHQAPVRLDSVMVALVAFRLLAARLRV